jgi:microcystin-dependent protein
MPSSDIIERINNLTIQDIAIIILILVVVYLLFRSNSCSENFDTNDSNTDALQNLGKISKEIMTANGTLTIPANTTKIPGNLIVDGDITFTSKNTKMMNIFPQFMVIAWANTIIPKGWAMCDGNMYTLDVNGNAIISASGIKSPDLRGRFILGSGNGINLASRKMNEMGGEENHTLAISEIPGHAHTVLYNFGLWSSCKDGEGSMPCGSNNTRPTNVITDYKNPLNNTNTQYGDRTKPADVNGNYPSAPHNNMPPFYALLYIMKL